MWDPVATLWCVLRLYAFLSKQAMVKVSVFIAVCSTLAFLLASPSAGSDSNVLLTGEVIDTDSGLSTPTANFIIQNDCNLVLYNRRRGYVSNTHGQGVNCTLTLNEYGQLVIRSTDGSTVWSTARVYSDALKGKYAAVLRPDDQVAVYGPMVWTTSSPVWVQAPFSSASAAGEIGTAQKDAFPEVQNVLFSGQILYGNAKLATRDYSFVMRSDCSLALRKASVGDLWISGTEGKGKNCFARLGYGGELTVVDGRYNPLWSNMAAVGLEGEYVLVLQHDGEAAIYGPVVWATPSFK